MILYDTPVFFEHTPQILAVLACFGTPVQSVSHILVQRYETRRNLALIDKQLFKHSFKEIKNPKDMCIFPCAIHPQRTVLAVSIIGSFKGIEETFDSQNGPYVQ